LIWPGEARFATGWIESSATSTATAHETRSIAALGCASAADPLGAAH
jgi:hypothetical protein